MNSNSVFRISSALLALALVTVALTTDAGPRVAAAAPLSASQTPGQPPTGDYLGTETCLACHGEQWTALSETPHGHRENPRTPSAGLGCETCHGPGKDHVDGGGDITKIRVFPTMKPREASAVCTTCHNRQDHAQWSSSMHDQRNLSCVSCHSVHSPKSVRAQLKTSTEVETCAKCHRPQALKLQRTAHMPLREGKMECSSCHNPHGSTNVRLLRTGNYVNESCVSCHAEKRGPFLFEHPPGRESCVTCHDPHGSSNDRLLVAKVPMLCQRCHIGTGHPSTVYDANSVKTSVRLFGRSCVACHENIHGTNSPSGAAFHR